MATAEQIAEMRALMPNQTEGKTDEEVAWFVDAGDDVSKGLMDFMMGPSQTEQVMKKTRLSVGLKQMKEAIDE